MVGLFEFLAQADPVESIAVALSAVVALGGVGYGVGSFFTSRRRGVADSLKTALDEVAVAQMKADRLAILASEKADELAAARMENQTLKDVLTSGSTVAPEIVKGIESALERGLALVKSEHEKTRQAFRELMEK